MAAAMAKMAEPAMSLIVMREGKYMGVSFSNNNCGFGFRSINPIGFLALRG